MDSSLLFGKTCTLHHNLRGTARSRLKWSPGPFPRRRSPPKTPLPLRTLKNAALWPRTNRQHLCTKFKTRGLRSVKCLNSAPKTTPPRPKNRLPTGERIPPNSPPNPLQLPGPLSSYAAVVAGWSSPVARQAHNLKVVGSNPTPATKNPNKNRQLSVSLTACFVENDLTHTLHTFTHVEPGARIHGKTRDYGRKSSRLPARKQQLLAVFDFHAGKKPPNHD